MRKQLYSYYIHILIISLLGLIPTTTKPRFDERLISQEEILDLLFEAQKEELPEITRGIVHPKKPLTFAVFMAADNDLYPFALKNLKQMELIGSNHNISIVAQINTPGYTPTKRYFIKQGTRVLYQDDENLNQKLNSGSPTTLIDFMKWVVTYHPADNYVLMFWNHGTGARDPNFARTINPCDLFFVNPTDQKLELDRGTSYLALMYQAAINNLQGDGRRGICFDDSFRSYISNHDLDFALYEICTNVLGGEKLALVGFDACLMSMIEVASITKKYARYMVSSQEVEYGTGLPYDLLLRPFLNRSLEPKEFAEHIVIAYEQAYNKLINDYTHSALDLSLIDKLEQNINTVSLLLQEALSNQYNHSISDMLRKCKSTQYCTSFDEPDYKDLAHLYQNILQHLQHIKLKDKQKEIEIQTLLQTAFLEGLALIPQIVIENRVGHKLRQAQGISIYFPEHAIPQSYLRSPFAANNNWGKFLVQYIFG